MFSVGWSKSVANASLPSIFVMSAWKCLSMLTRNVGVPVENQ